MLELLVERGRIRDFVERPVDLDAGKALLLKLGQLLAVLAFSSAHDGREDVEPRALVQSQDLIDHLTDRLRRDRLAGRGRIGHARARPKQAHVVVNLRHCSDGRARVLGGRFLLDRDGGRQTVYAVHVRLLHHLKELTGVGRQRLDVAPLALGIDRIEGER